MLILPKLYFLQIDDKILLMHSYESFTLILIGAKYAKQFSQ